MESVLAILLTLLVLFVAGRVTSLVVGRQAFNLFEAILERLPFVAKIYSSVRQLMDSHDGQKGIQPARGAHRLPIPGQCIGFLAGTLTDSTTGEPLAAVLVPDAINPTSAFLQILPLARVIDTDLTMEQAMSMLMTGGAVCPETITYTKPADPAP